MPCPARPRLPRLHRLPTQKHRKARRPIPPKAKHLPPKHLHPRTANPQNHPPNQPHNLIRQGQIQGKSAATRLHPFTLPDYAAPFLFIPPYLEVSFTTCSTIYVRHPTIVPSRTTSPDGKDTLDLPNRPFPRPTLPEGELYSMAWEHYTRNAPRTRADARRTKLEAEVGRNGFETNASQGSEYEAERAEEGWGGQSRGGLEEASGCGAGEIGG